MISNQEQIIPITVKLLTQLVRFGVKNFVVCAGARNASFVLVLEKSKGVNVFSHFEERSASFFALGLAQSERSPVAVITTSGTAVAECLPAVIEAHYSNWPLVVISADRPVSYRGTGAPQAIEQPGIFGQYPALQIDLQSIEDIEKFTHLPQHGPTHLNVCLEDPRGLNFDEEIDFQLQLSEFERLQKSAPENSCESLLIQQKKPIVIVAGLKDIERDQVRSSLNNFYGPVYIEHLSGLRGELETNISEEQITKLLSAKEADSVIRIGGIPTLRVWRDLEDRFESLPVVNITSAQFSGLARKENVSQHELQKFSISCLWTADDLIELKTEFKKQKSSLSQRLKQNPSSELALVRSLLESIEQKPLFVGNSLPIREVDQLSYDLSFKSVGAQRGANGIDGQVSTYLGWSTQFNESWCLVGDLTALYDLQALWLTRQLPKNKLRIVIINNSGGKIFEKMFKNNFFLNSHSLQFKSWAEMFNWSYHSVTTESQIAQLKLTQCSIIELRPES